MIDKSLKEKFEKIIEIKDVDWNIIDNVVKSDSNILRPIKGVAFEEYLKKLLKNYDKNIIIEEGKGDSDVDLVVNGLNLQLKTIATGYTKEKIKIAVSLHKTHGDETVPNNLYKISNKTFDFLCVFHPEKGVLIIPFDKIPLHNKWNEYLADPAYFEWNSVWINRWDLLNINVEDKGLDLREIPLKSELPFLSSETFLEDYEIIEMLCRPEYFRAAVMGLKGNLKEEWFKNILIKNGFKYENPQSTYSKFDVLLYTKNNTEYKIQVKGTSKNMCSLEKNTIGFEIMGTHGQFPKRGYKQSSIDFIAIIISEDQLNQEFDLKGLNFIIIPSNDLPRHFLIGNGTIGIEKGFANEKWNLDEFNDVLYPNIKLKYIKAKDQIIFTPNLESYKKSNGFETIPLNSEFRNNKKYILNKFPDEFNN
jgi:hypothetical protein